MKNSSLAYSVGLIIGDFVALVAAFVVAYILRVNLSHVPLSAHVGASTYINIVVSLLPIWLVIFAFLGLYSSRHYENRFSEIGRLFAGSAIGIAVVISYSYLANVKIFPARLVVLYGLLLAFLFVFIFRTLARGVRRMLFRHGRGVNSMLVVGDTRLTPVLVAAIGRSQAVDGDKVIGVVTSGKHPVEGNFKLFATFEEAAKHYNDDPPHMIVQTELYSTTDRNSEILDYAQQHHVDYRFVPGNNEMFVGKIEVELFHSVPMIAVHQTPLVGWGRVVKRTADIILSLLALIITSPILLATAILVKLSDGGDVFLRQDRLTRANRVFKVYKFRSHNNKYNKLSPEEAFTAMGKPELIKQYRDNGDRLDDDPRITNIGKFIRKFSIDELPQLMNVLKGDMSLVGPRALIPQELAKYSKRHTILSVRSGMTGLAQVSGRRDISFEERRKLDIYYVQNWTFWGDMVILVRTVWKVLFHHGAN
ncbi:sugar transferase [Candidatus Saccharibacteria bacterium]|nr:sugar transferase [Candidatus Saccharibacteria bacterium]